MKAYSPSRSADPTCLAEWFRRRVVEAPERPIVTFRDDCWTRREMQDRIDHLAMKLLEGDIRSGDRVGYIGFDHPLLLVALFATAQIGAIFVPINFRLSTAEFLAVVEDSHPHSLIGDADHGVQMDAAADLPHPPRIIALNQILESWRAKGEILRPAASAAAAAQAADVAMLIYTSGTTGVPKGVMLTHDNIWVSNVGGILANGYHAGDVALNCSPLFHAAGLNTLTLPILMAGGHLILHPGFDEDRYLEAVERHRVTVGLMVPTMMVRLSQHARFEDCDISSMRLLMTGGAPVPRPILEIYNRRGILTNQGYGMTETTAAVIVLSAEHAVEKVGSCGRTTLLADVKIVDPDGRRITRPGERGEICIRGRTVAAGYWNRPDETRSTFDVDGWVHSGDSAYFDEDGFYYICDRIKDMIITGGENVYAAEIESILYEHPSIAEVAIVGQPDEEWGERIVAVVALRPGCSLEFTELLAFIDPALARYKRPRELHFVETLPRTSTGKISKAAVRHFLEQARPVESRART